MSIKTESIKRVLRIQVRNPEKTTIWFAPVDEGKAFHCLECGKFMFYRQHRIIAIIQGDTSQEFKSSPIELQCQKCGHIYFINIY